MHINHAPEHLLSALTSVQSVACDAVTVKMTLGKMLTNMGIGTKQLSERYADLAQPSHDHNVYYGYEHSQPSHGHVSYSKHSYSGGGHKNNAAMSALTLLAFLFFLHILQQCLKDHMDAMQTPQIMVMTGGREGDVNIAKRADIKKIDKTGNILPSEEKRVVQKGNDSKFENDKNNLSSDEASDDVHLTKITPAEISPKIGTQKYKYSFKSYANRSSGFPHFVSVRNDNH